MAEKINVLRSTLTEMLRLPPDSDEATIRKAMREAIAANEATTAAHEAQVAAGADEQRLQAEDRRLVNAAFNEGRIMERDRWLGYLAADRPANRALLASLAPGLRPDEQVIVDEGLEATHRAVMARLGIKSAPEAANARTGEPRRVAAASRPTPPWAPSKPPPIGAPVDGLGLPIPQVPPPVRISRGTPPEQWTERQRQDAALRRLGPSFYPGTEPPPAQDVSVSAQPERPQRVRRGPGLDPKPQLPARGLTNAVPSRTARSSRYRQGPAGPSELPLPRWWDGFQPWPLYSLAERRAARALPA